FVADVGDHVVHAIDRSQERRLATAGWANERRDGARLDSERDVVQRLLCAIPERVDRRLDGTNFGGREVGRRANGSLGHPNRPVMYASVRRSPGAVNSIFVGATSISSPLSMNAVRSDTRAACCML